MWIVSFLIVQEIDLISWSVIMCNIVSSLKMLDIIDLKFLLSVRINSYAQINIVTWYKKQKK